MQRRVVITGLGVVAPNGIGKENFWNACISGRSGVRSVTRFDASPLPTRIAGEVADFDPEAFGISPQEARSIDRNTQFALAAANLALEDSSLPNELSAAKRDQMGVYIGSAMASIAAGEELYAGTRRKLSELGDQFGRNALPRERFVETAYWNPAVVTGKDGKTRVTFRAPMALSEYRFSARGVTGADTLVGQTSEKVAETIQDGRTQAFGGA